MLRAFSQDTKVIIIGAGPYGLSLAAHLRDRGIAHRIFGSPMYVWRQQMLAGMYLKSEGFASSLSAPGRHYTMPEFCAVNGIDATAPISLETFVTYGLWFQKQLVSHVEECQVVALDAVGHGFEVELATGECVRAEKVVVATGVSYFAYLPEQLSTLPADLVTHSSAHTDPAEFSGRDVTIIGGGQSALETAALLHEHGASVRVLVRKPELSWNATPKPGPRSMRERFRAPTSGLGPGRRTWAYEHLPLMFHQLSEETRVRLVRQELGPAGSYWLKDRVIGHVSLLLGHEVVEATSERDGLRLRVHRREQGDTVLHTDHVIVGTGYRPNLERLPFLGDPLRSRLRRTAGAPALSKRFESSVPGLYFVGLSAANSFGPLLRFVHGTGFTTRTVAAELARKVSHDRRVSAAQPASASIGAAVGVEQASK